MQVNEKVKCPRCGCEAEAEINTKQDRYEFWCLHCGLAIRDRIVNVKLDPLGHSPIGGAIVSKPQGIAFFMNMAGRTVYEPIAEINPVVVGIFLNGAGGPGMRTSDCYLSWIEDGEVTCLWGDGEKSTPRKFTAETACAAAGL